MEIQGNVNNKLGKSFPEFLVYIFYLVISICLTYFQIFGEIGSDILSHIQRIDPIMKGQYFMPHPLFHYLTKALSYLYNDYPRDAFLLLLLANFATLFILNKILNILLPANYRGLASLVFSVCLSVLSSIWIPWFNKSFYLGQWSPNIWHSPTFSLVKPFMLLSFFYIVSYIQERQAINHVKQLLASLFLALSALAKPSFMFSFAPALVVYLLFFKRSDCKTYIRVFLIFLPAFLIIFYQFIKTYLGINSSGTLDMKDQIIFTNFGVLKLYTPSIIISLILAIGFPLSILMLDFRSALKDDLLIMSFLNTIFGYLQAAFLAEKFKFDGAAFTFGYSLSLFLLLVFSLVFFIRWMDRQTIISWKVKCKAGFCALMFSLHLISGIIYLINNFYQRSF